MKVGQSFTLKPFNQRAKRLIADFGDNWLVVVAPRSMFCFNGEIGICARPFDSNDKFSNFKLKDVE